MIPGRFKTSYSFYFPFKNRIVLGILYWFAFLPSRIKFTTFGRIIYSDSFLNLRESFVRTEEIDPFDDSKLRYVVRVYKYDPKRKQIVPTRVTASTTLRGAKKLASEIADKTGLTYSQDPSWDIKEYVTIYGYRAFADYEKARVRSWRHKRGGG